MSRHSTQTPEEIRAIREAHYAEMGILSEQPPQAPKRRGKKNRTTPSEPPQPRSLKGGNPKGVDEDPKVVQDLIDDDDDDHEEQVDLSAIPIPDDYETMDWNEQRRLAKRFREGVVANRQAAIEIIQAEIARRNQKDD